MPVGLQNCALSVLSLLKVQCCYKASLKCAITAERLPSSHPSEPIRATQIRNVRLKQINRGRVGWNAELKWTKWTQEAPRNRIPTGPLACSSLRLSHRHLKSLLLNKMCVLFSFSASTLWSSNQLCHSFFSQGAPGETATENFRCLFLAKSREQRSCFVPFDSCQYHSENVFVTPPRTVGGGESRDGRVRLRGHPILGLSGWWTKGKLTFTSPCCRPSALYPMTLLSSNSAPSSHFTDGKPEA